MDEKTKMTALDAFSCKYSACKLGYIESPFTEALKPILETPTTRFQKRSPMMHRGYFARVRSQEKTIKDFLDATRDCPEGRQIVFVGAGYDPLGLEILSCNQSLRVFELDFPDVIRKKADAYRKVRSIQTVLTQAAEANSLFMSPALPPSSRGLFEADKPIVESFGALQMFGCDLRQVDVLGDVFQGSESVFSQQSPTLFISECVLVYLSAEESSQLINLFSNYLCSSTPALWISYDMINPNDAYGNMMLRNLHRAGYNLPGFESCSTAEAQCERFLSQSGWLEAHSQNMLFIYQNILDEAEKDRISHLEIMDEVEEWNMLVSHYTLTIAAKAVIDESSNGDECRQSNIGPKFLEMTRSITHYDPELHPKVRPVHFPSRK